MPFFRGTPTHSKERAWAQLRRERTGTVAPGTKRRFASGRAARRAGDVRLRVAAAGCSAAGSSSTPGAGGTDGAGTAELDGPTADALLGITGDGDRAIRKLTALQEYTREAQRVRGMQ